MNVFSSPSVLAAFERASYPETRAEPGWFELDGSVYLLPRDHRGRPVVRGRFLDFWEEADRSIARAGDVPKVRYLPRAVCNVRETDGRPELPTGYLPAPFIRWDRFSSFGEFQALVRTRNRGGAADSRRQLRRLERELGSVEFALNDSDPALLTACLAWKAQRYTNLERLPEDRFATDFFSRLRDDGTALFATCRAGGRVISVHIGLLEHGRYYYWMPAHDPSTAIYSPGRLLLEFLLEQSYQRNDEQFDFLLGDESYKWNFATDVRVVGPVGSAPKVTPKLTLARRVARARLGTIARTWQARARRQ